MSEYWSRRLPCPLTPVRGPIPAPLLTLEDCARAILVLPKIKQAKATWQHATELLMRAAETGKRADIEAAALQVGRAMAKERWVE